MADFQAVDGGEANMERARHSMEDVFLEGARDDDYLGAQMYTRIRFGPDSPAPLANEEGLRTTLMGYEFWPEALEATVRRAADVFGGPIYVTENGIGCTDDAERIEYVTAALEGLDRCLQDGLDVRGYFCWSCLDNFEWAEGYAPLFGLIAVDRETQVRTPKPSAHWLGQIARTNRLP
jgi:beta-glucosidase